MNEILFEILKAVVVLVIILVGRYLKQLAEAKEHEWIVKWVGVAVKATEQTIFGDKKGPERKAIVTKFIKTLLLKKNISLSDAQLENLIEAAVYAMKGGEL